MNNKERLFYEALFCEALYQEINENEEVVDIVGRGLQILAKVFSIVIIIRFFLQVIL